MKFEYSALLALLCSMRLAYVSIQPKHQLLFGMYYICKKNVIQAFHDFGFIFTVTVIFGIK